MNLYKAVCAILRGFSHIFFRFEVVGRENIPEEGNIIIVANHKSYLDPLFMLAAVKNRRIIPVAKKELFRYPILKGILKKLEVIPVDRANPGMSTVKSILTQIKNGRALGIFPEGTRAGKDAFLPAKQGVGLFAIKSKSNVVPMSIISKYRIFSKVKIVIGKPINMEEYFGKRVSKEEYQHVAQSLMDVVEKNYNENKEGII